MRRVTWLSAFLVVAIGTVAADGPDQAAKPSPPKAVAKVKAAAGAPAGAVAAPGQPKGKSVVDPRATSLYRSAQNLEKAGKKPGAIGLYRDLLIRYPESPEATEAATRLGALGGKIPTPSEINPAPAAEEAKFTRAPKPKYASQEANRAALNQAVGGMISGAASPPAAGGGYGNQGGYR